MKQYRDVPKRSMRARHPHRRRETTYTVVVTGADPSGFPAVLKRAIVVRARTPHEARRKGVDKYLKEERSLTKIRKTRVRHGVHGVGLRD